MTARTTFARTFALAASLLALAPDTAAARESMYSAERKLPQLEGVTVTEKLEAKLPLDVTFRDETGAPITLEQLVVGDKPVILTFNYSNCPMLCSVQLGDLVGVITEMPTDLGDGYHVVTIGLDPDETPARAAKTKARYLERIESPHKDSGWRFVTGEEEAIRTVADAVGFGYQFLEDKNQYAHPAVLILITPAGKVSQYIYGVTYDAESLTSALLVAAAGKSQEAAQRFILSCFHYEPLEGSAKTAASLMRYAGVVFLVLMVSAFAAFMWRRRRKKHPLDGNVP